MEFLNKKDGKVTFLLLIAILVIIVALGAYCYSILNSTEPTRPSTDEENTVIEESNTSTEVTNTSTSRSELKPVENMSSEMFSYEFLKLENEDAKKTNIIYSPLSIKCAMGLLEEGAEGETKAQIDKILGEKGARVYNNIDGVLSTANAVVIRDKFEEKVLNTYRENVEKKFGAEVIIDEFKDAKNVNKWISEKTFGIIENLIEDRLVQDGNLEMLLINALAIDMEWETKFDTNNTYGGTFDKDGENLKVAYMSSGETSTESYSFKVTDDVTVLSMDLKEYNGVQLEFDVIMPNEEDLDSFVEKIGSEKIDEYLSDLTNAYDTDDGIIVRIPKFDFDYSIRLKDELIAMGMEDAFNPSAADFSNMVEDNSLYVGEAIHKADIEFSEDGIRAAAVTVFAMELKSAIMDPTHPVEITIDKPFMFIIRDKSYGDTWFVGTVYKPVLWNDVKAEYEPQF